MVGFERYVQSGCLYKIHRMTKISEHCGPRRPGGVCRPWFVRSKSNSTQSSLLGSRDWIVLEGRDQDRSELSSKIIFFSQRTEAGLSPKNSKDQTVSLNPPNNLKRSIDTSIAEAQGQLSKRGQNQIKMYTWESYKQLVHRADTHKQNGTSV